MGRLFLMFLLLVSFPLLCHQALAQDAVLQEKSVLITNISIEGFVLQDKDQFLKLFKPYRNKHLTTSQMDEILKKIQDIYEKEGYKELVSITYKVTKHRLVYTALMVN